MKDLAKRIYKKYHEGGKVKKYQSDLLKEVEGMGPEGKSYLKDKLEGKEYKGELKDEYKHDLDKELEGMSEEGKSELKHLLGVDEDPWKDVKEELDGKKKDKRSIGELMAHSEEGYAEGGDVSTKRYISKLTPEQRREAADEELFAIKKPKGAKFAWRPDQKKVDTINKKYGIEKLNIEEENKALDKQAKSSKMKKIIERERSRFAKGGEAFEDMPKDFNFPTHIRKTLEWKDGKWKRKDQRDIDRKSYTRTHEETKEFVMSDSFKPRDSKGNLVDKDKYARGGEAKKDWIQGAVKKPGALRAIAEKEKLIKGDEKLSGKDLSKLSSQAKKKKNKLLAKRVALAKTFAKMRK